jgi:hypothetical protein
MGRRKPQTISGNLGGDGAVAKYDTFDIDYNHTTMGHAG